jgi:hypothetical protein
MNRPNFFIVGAPKCGTTSMYEYLRQHPDVFMPPHRKEAKYFCTDLDFNPGHLIPDEASYLALFADAGGASRVGEASPPYLYSEAAAQGIKRFDPQARIIVMLREPVDFMYSLHRHMVGMAYQDLVDFEEALEAGERRRRQDARPSFCHVSPRWLWYRWMATFSPHVERYLALFGRRAVHVVVFDDLRERPADAYRQVLEFLGVDPGFAPAFVTHNPASDKQNRNLALKRLFKTHRGLVRLRKRLGLFNRRILRGGGRLLDRLPGRVELPRAVDPGLRRRLAAEFAPEVRRLGQLIGRDLSAWSRTEN